MELVPGYRQLLMGRVGTRELETWIWRVNKCGGLENVI